MPKCQVDKSEKCHPSIIARELSFTVRLENGKWETIEKSQGPWKYFNDGEWTTVPNVIISPEGESELDTYTRKNVPHCPNCHSQRVHHVSRWIWVMLYVIICIAMSIVIIGLFMLLLTPLVWFIPGYWVCRNCKQKTKDKDMLFGDVTEKKINHNDKRTFF